jgi:hypothetical protein
MKVSGFAFIVSFNCYFGIMATGEMDKELSCGEESMNSTDFVGDDKEALIAEVIAETPSLKWHPLVDDVVVGTFNDDDDPEYPVAVMYRP